VRLLNLLNCKRQTNTKINLQYHCWYHVLSNTLGNSQRASRKYL